MIVTKYGIYAVFDAALQAFLPETAGVFLTDKQFVHAIASVIAKSPKEKDFSNYRFYRVCDFVVDVVPTDAKELTNDVNSCVKVLRFIPSEVEE